MGARRARLGRARVDPRARDRLPMPATRRKACSATWLPTRRPSRSAATTARFCEFRPVCEEHWEAVDHLTRVAGMRRDQVLLLEAAGVTTLTQLATLPPGFSVPDLRPDALGALTQQARLQLAAVEGDTPPHELLPPEEGAVSHCCPSHPLGDVMFDFEGDPFWTPARGLDVPHGTALPRRRRAGATSPSGRTTGPTRRRRSSALVDLLTARLAEFPDMHVYHYSSAEPTVVKQLMAQHATREAEVDDLLRRGVFVDLLTVDRQAPPRGRAQLLAQADRAARRVRARGRHGRRLRSRAGVRAAGATRGRRPSSTRSRPTTRRIASRRSRCATGCSRCGRRESRVARPDRVAGAGRGGRRGRHGTRAARGRSSLQASPRGPSAGSPASCSSTTAARIDPSGGGTSPVARWTRATSSTTARRSAD